ncbi:MAG: hypothetical protein ACYCV7_17065 [Acidimicrobiales bacterium]
MSAVRQELREIRHGAPCPCLPGEDGRPRQRRWVAAGARRPVPVVVLARRRSGSRFSYEYDFGTTTELAGRALALVPGSPTASPIQVLARNEPPICRCAECGQDATKLCAMCNQGMGTPCWYCDACSDRHRWSDPDGDYFLPVVNSPRVGLCGYCGPADG